MAGDVPPHAAQEGQAHGVAHHLGIAHEGAQRGRIIQPRRRKPEPGSQEFRGNSHGFASSGEIGRRIFV